MDLSTGKFIGSPFLATMTLLGEIFAIAAVLASPEARRLLLRSWPILAFIAISFASIIWSRNPKATLDVCFRNVGTFLLGIVIVSLMPKFLSIRFAIRTMVFGCILSILWVFFFPDVAIHQADDVVQNVHAGLWRGIFSHKQGLGYFAGLTTGLLLYYRTAVFPLPIFAIALTCSLTCLFGTESATGFVAMALAPGFLFAGRTIISAPKVMRRQYLLAFVALAVLCYGGFETGLLNFIITKVLDKSTDLTGRADFWPIAIANFNNSGSSWFGGGLGTDFASDLSEWSIDNGYIDMLIDFGYIGVPLVFIIYAMILYKSAIMLMTTSSDNGLSAVFPFGIVLVILVVNITESNFLTKCFSTLLTAIAVAILFDDRDRKATKPRRQQTTGAMDDTQDLEF